MDTTSPPPPVLLHCCSGPSLWLRLLRASFHSGLASVAGGVAGEGVSDLGDPSRLATTVVPPLISAKDSVHRTCIRQDASETGAIDPFFPLLVLVGLGTACVLLHTSIMHMSNCFFDGRRCSVMQISRTLNRVGHHHLVICIYSKILRQNPVSYVRPVSVTVAYECRSGQIL